MTHHTSEIRCPRCGEASTGRFCVGCGTAVRDVSCDVCGETGAPGARFCANCGAQFGAAAGGGAPAAASRGERLTRVIAGAAVLALVAFVAGQAAGRRSGGGGQTDPAGAAQTVALAGAPSAPTAPDISAMSPEERASRLFNRVMAYSEQGKMDSARFFAPMAMQAYAMLGPLDAHGRYDVGELSAAIGDAVAARAAADTILATTPNHLLGLVLAIRAADLAHDSAASARFSRRLIAAAPAERATGRPEYTEHARDLDDALKKAAAKR